MPSPRYYPEAVHRIADRAPVRHASVEIHRHMIGSPGLTDSVRRQIAGNVARAVADMVVEQNRFEVETSPLTGGRTVRTKVVAMSRSQLLDLLNQAYCAGKPEGRAPAVPIGGLRHDRAWVDELAPIPTVAWGTTSASTVQSNLTATQMLEQMRALVALPEFARVDGQHYSDLRLMSPTGRTPTPFRPHLNVPSFDAFSPAYERLRRERVLIDPELLTSRINGDPWPSSSPSPASSTPPAPSSTPSTSATTAAAATTNGTPASSTET